MRKHKLMKNKLYAIILIAVGACTIPIERDVTVFIFTLIVGAALLFAKKNWIQ